VSPSARWRAGSGSKKTGQQVVRASAGRRLKQIRRTGLARTVVPSAMVVMSRKAGLLEILRGGDLPAIGRVLEFGSETLQLRGVGGIAAVGSRLRGRREIVGDGVDNLIELGWTL